MLGSSDIQRLAVFMATTLNAPSVAIENVVRIQGGASRETFRFDARTQDCVHGLILRRDPPAQLVDTDRRLEYAAFRSFHGASLPVPKPIALSDDPNIVGRPFMVMERVDDAVALLPFLPDPFGKHREKIGRAFFEYLGAIHAVDPMQTELATAVEAPTPSRCWSHELDHWQQVIELNALEPQPIAMAAIRRLRRSPPPPPKRLAAIHGDYRTGNYLVDAEGDITAVLDWELAHIGDPLEDLAWALDPLWATKNGLAAGMLPFDEAIGIWESASGRTFDPATFKWWSLFSSVKGLGVWLSCARRFHDNHEPDPILAFSGWYCRVRHDKIIADRLSAAAPGALQ